MGNKEIHGMFLIASTLTRDPRLISTENSESFPIAEISGVIALNSLVQCQRKWLWTCQSPKTARPRLRTMPD